MSIKITDDSIRPLLDSYFDSSTTIENLRRLSGGASRETWAFTVSTDEARHDLVLRRDHGSNPGSTDRATEYELLKVVEAGGVLVPEVKFVLPPEANLGEGFVMNMIAGETIPRKILRDDEFEDARLVLAQQCGIQAALIHQIDVTDLPALLVLGPQEQIKQHRDLIDALGEPHPAFELGLQWLENNIPEAVEPKLVHGDFRNGNLIVGPEGLRAVLDWELSHLGDPAEDLGWCCVRSWRFGVNDKPVGGFGSRKEMLDAYVDAGGEVIDEQRLFFWEVLGTLKWGVICEMQAFTHLSGRVRSVELATLGRRIAETEWDLLRTIYPEQVADTKTTTPVATDTGSIHDRPRAAELLEAVREFIERDVRSSENERLAFHARVAMNALGIVERELILGESIDSPIIARLGNLLDEKGSPSELVTQLSARIRAGDPKSIGHEGIALVCDLVRAKLEVANPHYLEDE